MTTEVKEPVFTANNPDLPNNPDNLDKQQSHTIVSSSRITKKLVRLPKLQPTKPKPLLIDSPIPAHYAEIRNINEIKRKHYHIESAVKWVWNNPTRPHKELQEYGVTERLQGNIRPSVEKEKQGSNVCKRLDLASVYWVE